MKALLFANLFILLFTAATQAQDASPSKEETLEWLEEKFKNNLHIHTPWANLEIRDLKLALGSDCELIITFKEIYVKDYLQNNKKGDLSSNTTIKLPIKGFKIEREYDVINGKISGAFVYDYNAISKIYDSGETVKTKNSITTTKSSENYGIRIITTNGDYNAYGYSLLNNEENLYERIEKAIAHLSTFCEKKKEKF